MPKLPEPAAATEAQAAGAKQDELDDDSTYVYDFYTVVAPNEARGGGQAKAGDEASEAVTQQSPSRQFVKMSQLFYLDGSSAAGDVLFDFGDEDEDDEDFGCVAPLLPVSFLAALYC